MFAPMFLLPGQRPKKPARIIYTEYIDGEKCQRWELEAAPDRELYIYPVGGGYREQDRQVIFENFTHPVPGFTGWQDSNGTTYPQPDPIAKNVWHGRAYGVINARLGQSRGCIEMSHPASQYKVLGFAFSEHSYETHRPGETGIFYGTLLTSWMRGMSSPISIYRRDVPGTTTPNLQSISHEIYTRKGGTTFTVTVEVT